VWAHLEAKRGVDDKVVDFEGVHEVESVNADLLAKLGDELADGVGLALLDVALLAEHGCVHQHEHHEQMNDDDENDNDE
jgi:hypothetical protein